VAKLKPYPDEIVKRAIAAVAAAWESGCPVAGSRPEVQVQLADVCLRRLRSINRRGIADDDREGQIRDMARGMVETSGQTRGHVGPFILDYEWLAAQVLAAITDEGKQG
jgi:hypothetical protein